MSDCISDVLTDKDILSNTDIAEINCEEELSLVDNIDIISLDETADGEIELFSDTGTEDFTDSSIPEDISEGLNSL